MYSVCKWIRNPILSHFDLSLFEIGLLEVDKINYSNNDRITIFFLLCVHGIVLVKIYFQDNLSSKESAIFTNTDGVKTYTI